jgi:hypothetical protein
MSVKKVVKFAEEKENTKDKKMQRAKERNTKYAENETKVIEEPPQHETRKEFEETFAHYKRCCDPKDILYQDHTHFKPIKEIVLEDIMPEHKESEEGWESDCDGWFD